VEVFTGFILPAIIGVALLVGLAFVFRLKTKGLLRLGVNSLGGIVILLLFNLFKIAALPLNPFNALIVGFLGVPGVAVVFLISIFL